MSRQCGTCHHACACREAHFARLEKELEELRKCPNEAWECAREIKRLEKELEAARAEVEEHRKELDSVEANLLAADRRTVDLQSQLEQARQSNEQLAGVVGFLIKTFEPGTERWKMCADALSAPPLPASRVKRLEDVARAARHLLRNYLKCPQYPENVEIRAHVLDPLRNAVVALDAADFTPVRDNCGSGNLGKQEQNEPARQGEGESHG